ncbi:MAG: hypothetical protein M3209_18620 [Acidobacteriota bacterium]|nr:hypothetical protein [Acidobacteriota bacterium]
MLFCKFLSSFLVFCGLAAAGFVGSALAQNQPQNQEKQEKKEKQEKPKPVSLDIKNPNAEQVAELSIHAYGGYGGRVTLAQIRKTEIETGQIRRFGEDGRTDESTYERRIMRGTTLDKDRVRINQRTPQAEYALIYDTAKTIGIINNTTFTPRVEADRAFQAQMFHSLDALLRYKENGSALKLIGKDKNMNVEFFVLEVTDKQGHTTRFNISAKTFRVQSLEYSMALTESAAPTKFVRRFYDYRVAQGTLVPYRSVLFADGKQIEETNVLTVTYGTKIDEAQFQAE